MKGFDVPNIPGIKIGGAVDTYTRKQSDERFQGKLSDKQIEDINSIPDMATRQEMKKIQEQTLKNVHLTENDVNRAEYFANKAKESATGVPEYIISASVLGFDNTGAEDVTKQLQAEIDNAYNLGYNKVIFETGTYLVSTQAPTEPISNSLYGGLELKPNTVYDLNGSTIKMATNNSKGYNIIRIGGKKKYEYCDNVTLKNGTIIGDRQTHDYTTISSTHEFGFGVAIHNGRNVIIENMTITQCTGDCIFIGQAGNMTDCHSENITIRNCDLSYARRNIISPCSFDGLLIENCKLSYAGGSATCYDGIAGTDPMFGIDIEPWSNDPVHGEIAKNAVIKDCHFKECYRAFIGVPRCDDVLITGCTFDNEETVKEHAEYTLYVADRNSYIAMEKCIFTNVTGMNMNGFVTKATDCDMGGTRLILGGQHKYSDYYFAKNCKASELLADFNADRQEYQRVYVDGCTADKISGSYAESFQIVNSEIGLKGASSSNIMVSNSIVKLFAYFSYSVGTGLISNSIIDCSELSGRSKVNINVSNCKFINLKQTVSFYSGNICDNSKFTVEFDTINGSTIYGDSLNVKFDGTFKNCEFDLTSWYDTCKTEFLNGTISTAYSLTINKASNSYIKFKSDTDKKINLGGTGLFFNTIFENVGDNANALAGAATKEAVNCHFINCK